MINTSIYSELTSEQIIQREFIKLLEQLASATGVMRRSVEEIDIRLKEAHEIQIAA